MWTTVPLDVNLSNPTFNHFVPLLDKDLVVKHARYNTGVFATESFLMDSNPLNRGAEGVKSILDKQIRNLSVAQ